MRRKAIYRFSERLINWRSREKHMLVNVVFDYYTDLEFN